MQTSKCNISSWRIWSINHNKSFKSMNCHTSFKSSNPLYWPLEMVSITLKVKRFSKLQVPTRRHFEVSYQVKSWTWFQLKAFFRIGSDFRKIIIRFVWNFYFWNEMFAQDSTTKATVMMLKLSQLNQLPATDSKRYISVENLISFILLASFKCCFLAKEKEKKKRIIQQAKFSQSLSKQSAEWMQYNFFVWKWFS